MTGTPRGLLAGQRVLLAEDHAFLAAQLAAALQREGASVEAVAPSGISGNGSESRTTGLSWISSSATVMRLSS